MFGWTFGRKVGAGFAVASLALAVIAIVGYRSAQNLIHNDELVAHTHQVRRQIADLYLEITTAETGQRGMVITNNPEFLDPYTKATANVDLAITNLRELTRDNPGQTQRIDRLRPLVDAKLAEMKAVLDLRKTSFETAGAHISAGEGRQQMQQIRAILDEMDGEEERLLSTRNKDAKDATDLTTTVILWGSIAAIALTVVIGFVLTRSLSRQIGSAVRHVQSSSTELQAAANQQASSAAEQATAMSEIATTISELLATSRQIAESAQRVSQIAGQTATAARSGDNTVQRGNDASATVRRQVDLVVTHMLDLGKKSQQVGGVLDIVAELAEQTNILAINATIEAAGAGEAGRRFGVVADEIRKLADRVTASTKEIRVIIDDVRGAVNTTVMATEAGSKAVDSGAAQVAETAVAFRQIAALVATTTDAAREIELSTKQQASAVEQVNVAITNVAQTTRETETSATQTLQTSAQLTKLSTDLSRLVQAGEA
jgi:methyl-accepting chemotaxis protein